MSRKAIVLLYTCTFLVSIRINFAQSSITDDSLKALISKTTDLRERYALLSKIGSDYYRAGTGEYSVADKLELVRIALKLKDDSLIADSYDNAGDFYLYERGDNNTAVDYFFKALPYAEKAGSKRGLSSTYVDMSDAYWALGNFSEQLNYLKKAEASLPDKSHPDYNFMLIQVVTSFSMHYLAINKPELALPYLNVYEEINQKLRYPMWVVYGGSLLGTYHMEMGDLDLAQDYFRKSSLDDTTIDNTYVRCFYRCYYINFLIHTGNYKIAKSQSDQMLQISKKAQNNYFRLKATGYLKTIFDKESKIDSAYFYSKLESALKDTIFNMEKLNKIQSLNFNEELRVLEENSKKAEAEKNQRQNIQYALIALGIISFIIVFFLLSRSIIVNEKWISFFGVLGLLVVLEFIYLVIHPSIALLTRDSPILMLLALVAIASLLIPLHHRIEKWVKEKVTEKNKKIRLENAKKTIEKLEGKVVSVDQSDSGTR